MQHHQHDHTILPIISNLSKNITHGAAAHLVEDVVDIDLYSLNYIVRSSSPKKKVSLIKSTDTQ